jgi:hypothetical protein
MKTFIPLKAKKKKNLQLGVFVYFQASYFVINRLIEINLVFLYFKGTI